MSRFRIAGHWRRESITGPGMEDRTTRVHWLQSERGYCDIRIPLSRPDTCGAKALADLPPAALLGLMNGFGFAGDVALQDARCTWHRQIAFHGTPPGAPPDIGILRDGPGGRMIEDGAEGPYREVWSPEAPGPFGHALWWHAGRALRITWGPSGFLLALGRPGAPDSLPLRQQLEAGEAPVQDLAAQFDAEYTLGGWDGDQGIARLSTNPLREGQPVLRRAALDQDELSLTRPDFHGLERTEAWRR